jgi:hypothetical protein
VRVQTHAVFGRVKKTGWLETDFNTHTYGDSALYTYGKRACQRLKNFENVPTVQPTPNANQLMCIPLQRKKYKNTRVYRLPIFPHNDEYTVQDDSA